MRRQLATISGSSFLRLTLRIFTLLLLFCSASVTNAQRNGSGVEHPIPTPRYYSGVHLIESGDFTRAANFYRQELKGAFRIGTSLWLDSICYYAMLGESYYQAGLLNEALTNYNSALSIATSYPNWIGRVSYSTGVSTRAKGAAPWGPSRRQTPLGVFPDKATITIGDKITEDRIKQGGMLQEQKAIPIDPAEIMRCIALSIRRRGEILGPLAPFDPISQQILETYRVRAVAPNHWSIAWLDVLWGMALSECDKTTAAANTLSNALVMAGTYDHTLTGQALLELGNLFIRNDKVREAAECYYEASISAYHYGDNLLVEEAIRKYSNATKALGRWGEDPVANLAFRWSKTLKNSAAISSSFALELIEEFIYAGKLKLATNGLASIDRSMRGAFGQSLRASRVADQWNYLNALLFYANGNIPDGDVSLAKVVEGCKLHSPWILQLMRLDNYVKNGLSSNGALTPRNAADLYETLLREPTVVDWAFRPTESLSIQMTAPPEAYERWFCILMDRDLKDKAFEVGERIRRERFFRTQTYGGRLLSLRYILTADDALATQSTRNTRQTLFFEYPEFSEMVTEVKALTDELNSLPTVPTDSDVQARQASLFARLGEVSTKQEALMRFIASGRVRIPYVFPPVYSVDEVKARLPEETAILSFIDAEGQTFGFMIGKENLDAWRVGPTQKVGVAVGTFLRTIGNADGTREVSASDLSTAHWKSQGARLREIILGAQDVDADRFNIVFSKLSVVPDGPLWYLPFEALCLPALASTPEEAQTESEGEASAEVKSGVLQSSDAALAGSDSATSSSEQGEDEDDLDIAYRQTDEEAQAAQESEEDGAESEEEVAETEESVKEETQQTKVAETKAPPKPVKRKSRSAREREALEEYEASLIPMIQASELTIRYSATVSLSLPNALGRNAFVETTVAGGTIYPKQPRELVEAAVDRFATAVNKTEAFRVGSLNLPGGIYASRLKRLVVFDEIAGSDWNWSPLTPGKTRVGNSASDWILSPWGAPRLIVAPGLRTHAEDSLKNGGDGSELFLPILAMQASGADSMLLSRWRTGGRSSYDLATDFVKNYEEYPTAEAWKQAVLKLTQRDVVVEEEPRLRKLGKSESVPKYDSPFWWAGYILIDSGEAIQPQELEEFDMANVKKAEEEKALLDGGKKDEKPTEFNPNEVEGSSEDSGEPKEDAGVVEPKFVNKNPSKSKESKDSTEEKTDAEPEIKEDKPALDLGPKALSDDDLAAADEEGDDFFAINEDEEPLPEPTDGDDDSGTEAPTSDDAKDSDDASEPDEDAGLATDDEKGPTQPEVKSEPKNSEPKKTEPKKIEAKPVSKGATSEKSEKSGRLSLKPKK